MHLPAEVPKLSKLPFIIGDVALFAIVGFIAIKAPDPFSGGALIAMTCCGTLGALLLAVPFVLDYGRKTDALLSDRQDQIAALAQTTSASAEQVSIAAVGLQSIAEVSARTAKALETLPLKLQEKIAEFKSQLNEVSVTENEALEQELQTLRTAETERLQSAVDELAKAAKDLGKLEALVRAQASAAQETASSLHRLADASVARIDESIKGATQAARSELESAFAHHRSQLQADVASAQNQSIATWNGRVSQALAEIDLRLEAFSRRLATLTDQAVHQAEVTHAPKQATPPPAPAAAAVAHPPAAAPLAPATSPVTSVPSPTSAAAGAPTPSPVIAVAPASAGTAAPAAADVSPSVSSKPTPEPVTASPIVPAPAPVRAAAPSVAATVSSTEGDVDDEDDEAGVVSPATAPGAGDAGFVAPSDLEDPFAEPVTPKTKAKSNPPPSFAELDLDLPPPVRPAPARTRTPAPAAAPAPVAPAPSVDGATRLLVTAYIGIGNKLFVRGSGPGLSWDKGVPLQFVSIGKWRWDTAVPNVPVALKLYKNDQIECTAVGTLELEPGHHHEVTATF
ncbi:MAG: hypothetical protein JNN01_10675 [Opitutaceae bacterium]|nr:hypothetical protein [Opitutaceae bacterium]